MKNKNNKTALEIYSENAANLEKAAYQILKEADLLYADENE